MFVNCAIAFWVGLGADAWDVLLLVGIMLSAMGFFAEFIGSRLNRRAREDTAEINERNQRFEDSARGRKRCG